MNDLRRRDDAQRAVLGLQDRYVFVTDVRVTKGEWSRREREEPLRFGVLELARLADTIEAERRDRIADCREPFERDEVQIIALVLVVTVQRYGGATGQRSGDPGVFERLAHQRGQFLQSGLSSDDAHGLWLLSGTPWTLPLAVVSFYIRLRQ